jgi:hypothetical protein
VLRQWREMTHGLFDPSPPIGATLMLDGERFRSDRMRDDLIDLGAEERPADQQFDAKVEPKN